VAARADAASAPDPAGAQDAGVPDAQDSTYPRRATPAAA